MKYDLVVVVDPASDEKTAQEKVTELLTKNGFTVSDVTNWGKKSLTYEIKKQNEGLYFTALADSDKNTPKDLYTAFKLEESIIRSLILKHNPNKKITLPGKKGKEKKEV